MVNASLTFFNIYRQIDAIFVSMSDLNTTNINALSLLFTEDIYAVADDLPVAEKIIEPNNQAKADETTFNYLGENNKYFLILVNDEQHKTLNKNDLELLLKILLAKKLELRDVAILNLHQHQNISFEMLRAFFSNNRLLLFGINPAAIGLEQLSANQVITKEKTKILATYGLPELSNDKAKKAALWAVLQGF